MTGPYRVEVDDQGCGECQHDRTWNVIGPDDTASSTSYGDLDDAESLKRALDAAYELGRQSGAPQALTPFAPGSMPPTDDYLYVWDAEFKCLTRIYYSSYLHTQGELTKRQYTHWLPDNAFPDPNPPVEQVAAPVAPEPPLVDLLTIQPAPTPEPIIKDWDDDIPF